MKITSRLKNWRRPEVLLLIMAGGVPLSFATWQALLNNFAVESAAFTGAEIGILQSLREIPGFLAFAVVFVLLLLREQMLAYVALALLGIGTAITGLFPTTIGLYCTTVLMSLGYHYYETVQTSLSLQLVDKQRAPEFFGRIIAVGSLTSIITFALIWLAFDWLDLGFQWVYAIGGGITFGVAIIAYTVFPKFSSQVEQNKKIVLRGRYWLYYALTFMSGARRQIFVVFAGFLMVEKFGFDVAAITLLFLVNAAVNIFPCPPSRTFDLPDRGTPCSHLRVHRINFCVHCLCVCRARGSGRYPVRDRPPLFCPGDCHRHVLPENCRPGRHCFHRRCLFYHQPHRPPCSCRC